MFFCSITDEQAAPVEKFDDLKKGKTVHLEIQFLDQSSNCNFFCRVYYAEKFSWLRSLVLPDGEEAYIRSLRRCVQWNARGGKSGSSFCKTKGKLRFVNCPFSYGKNGCTGVNILKAFLKLKFCKFTSPKMYLRQMQSSKT